MATSIASSTDTLVGTKPDLEKAITIRLDERSFPSSYNSETSSLEGTTDLVKLPQKHGSTPARYLRHTFFTVYKKTFTLVFVLNLAAFITFVAIKRGSPTLSNTQLAVSANAMVAMLMRQEHVINSIYHIFTSVPHSLPLAFRKKLAKCFHYGGIHSGAGVAATMWFILYTVLATQAFFRKPSRDTATNLITSYIVVTMFFFLLISAHPRIRFRIHDYFEMIHRYAGWTTLVTLWTHTILDSSTTANATGQDLGLVIAQSPSFWFLLVSTMVPFINWGHLKHRDVYPEVLSSHATRLHFKYRNTKTCYAIRLSHNPTLDWHSFATIPDSDGGFSVIVSNAGDWTKKTIEEPPKKIWVRGWPVLGLHYTAHLFKKTVLVATGSGIGPILSLIAVGGLNCRIIWSTPNPESTYGQAIIDAVYKADPHAIIWNTRAQGRPDIVMLTYQLYAESGAEAVFIVSNPKVTHKVVYGLESRGVPTFGSLFDQ